MEYLEEFPSLKLTSWCRVRTIQDLLSGFADSDLANSSSLRSTSGNVMIYNKAPIMSLSKMRTTTALSTAEAEYYHDAASMAESKVVYLRKLLEFGFHLNVSDACARTQPRLE